MKTDKLAFSPHKLSPPTNPTKTNENAQPTQFPKQHPIPNNPAESARIGPQLPESSWATRAIN